MNDDEEWYQWMEENELQGWQQQMDDDKEWIKRQLGVNDANKQR